jgi:hypothetical protein
MLFIELFGRSFRAYRGVTLNHAESGMVEKRASRICTNRHPDSGPSTASDNGRDQREPE